MAPKRITDKKRSELLARFEGSGRSAAAFCREHRLPYQSFLAWRRAVKKGGPAAAGRPARTQFVEIEVNGEQLRRPGPAAGPAVELAIGAGMILRIYPPQGGGARP